MCIMYFQNKQSQFANICDKNEQIIRSIYSFGFLFYLMIKIGKEINQITTIVINFRCKSEKCVFVCMPRKSSQ